MFKKPDTVIEIGNDWLKVAESYPSKKSGCITKLKLSKLIQIKEPLQEAIAGIFRDLKLDKGKVITYIPRHLVTMRILELPSTDPREIGDIVNLQVGKQTPYSKEEIVSSYILLESEKQGYSKVILVIARKNIISERLGTLHKAGIEVAKIGVSSEAILRWFGQSYPGVDGIDQKEPVILVDIDSNFSDFLIIRKKKLVFTRNILIGANHLLENSLEVQDKFIEELKRSLELYQNEARGVKIGSLFLCGAVEKIKDIDKVLSAKLDLPCQTKEQTHNISLKKDIRITQQEGFGLVSLTGIFGACLASRDLVLDLTPMELRIQKQTDESRKNLSLTGILFIAVMMMVTLSLLVNIFQKNNYLTQLESEISKIKAASTQVEKMRMEIAILKKRLDSKGTSIDTLAEIYKLIPKEIYLTDLNIEEKNKVILKGRATATSEVFNLIALLEKSPLFKSVKNTYTNVRRDKEGEFTDFEILCNYSSIYQ